MGRLRQFWQLLWCGKWKPVMIIVGAVGTYDLVVAQGFPNSDLPTVSTWIPTWDWWAWVILILVLVLVAIVEGSYRLNKLKEPFEKGKAGDDIGKVIDGLKTICIIDGKSGNITRVLYALREKLSIGLSHYEASVQDKMVLDKLNLRNVVRLEQRRRSSGPRQYDEGFWVLTGLGREVILYLEKNKQILDYRGKVEQKPFDTEQSLILTIQEYAIGLSGMKDYPQKPENAAWLRLKVAVNPISKPIDTLDIIIGSETIHVNNWPRKLVATFTAYFKVTEWQWKGEHQVELIAKVGGKSYSFGRTLIDFNIEPGGRGHLI